MAKLNELIVTIGAKTRKFDYALGQSMRKMQNFGKSTKQLGQSMTRSLTMPIAALGAAAIKSAADLETMETSFISLTGGAKQAADMMRNLNDFTAKTPFQIEAVAKSARQLIASGSGIDEVNTQLQFLGDIAATSGQPIDEIAAIFSKVNAKGKVELESLNQLAERGIPIFTALSEATGLPADKLGAGAVSVEQFNEVLKGFSAEGGFAAGAMERLSQTAAGKFSTALDNLKLAGASLAESLMPVLKDMLDKFTGLMQTITQLSPETKKYVLIAGGIGAALGPLLMVLPAIIQGFTMLISPIGLVVTAIAALGYAIVTFADEIAPYITDVINGFITLYNESSLLRGVIGGIKGTVQVVFSFFLFAIDSVIEGFKDLGTIIGALMRGEFSAIPDIIGQAFVNAGERMAEFGTKAAEDWMTAVEDHVNREPISLVSEDTVAETLRTLGGLTTMMDNLFAGAGGGAVEGPSVTPPVINTTLNIVDIDMPEDVVEEEDINQVIAAADLVKRQTQAMAQSVAGFVEHTFNQVMSGTQTFSEVMRDMIKNLVKQIAVMIAQFVILNTIFGSMGVGGLSLGKFIGQGLGIPQFAGGGIVSGPVIAQVGEYAGASHNPEVIAPLDKLQSMMGGQAVQVTGKISGRDILLTSERNSIDRNRVRGF